MSMLVPLLQAHMQARRETLRAHGRWKGLLVEGLPPGLVGVRDPPLGRGGHGVVYEGVLRGTPPADWMGRLPAAGFAVKEYTDLEDEAQHNPELLAYLARFLVLPEDAALRGDAIVLPLAYTYDSRLQVLLERFDADLQSRLRALPAHAWGGAAIGALISGARGLADAHCAGYAHRDVKTTNLLLRGQRVAWTDWDGMSADDGDRPEKGATTTLNEKDIVIASFEYASPSVISGVSAVPPTKRDIYGMGRIIAEVMGEDLQLETDAYRHTRLERRRAFRASDDLERRAAALGLAGLERVMVRATDEERGYRSMLELVEDLEAVARGHPEAVVARADNRLSWMYRKGEAVGSAIRRRALLRTAAIASASGATALAGMPWLIRRIDDHRRERLYAASVEGLARKAAASDLAAVDIAAFIRAQAERFKDDMRAVYLPQWETGTRKLFPFGVFTDRGPQFYTGRDADAGNFLELLRMQWHLTGEEEFLRWYVLYAQQMDFELSGAYSDYEKRALGRYAPLLAHLPSTIAALGTGHEREVAALREAHTKSVVAAILALRQYDARSKSFQGPAALRDERMMIHAGEETFLGPMLAAMAQSPDLERIIDPGREEVAALRRLRIRGEPRRMGLQVFYRMLAENTLAVCDALVRRSDGKSFFMARIDGRGTVLERKTMSDAEPGYYGSEDDQPVVAQAHMQLLLSLCSRVESLSRVFESPVDARALEIRDKLQVELRGGYPAFTGSMEKSIAQMRAYQDAMFRYCRKGDDPLAWYREYLYLPAAAGKTRNLRHEHFSAATYANALTMVEAWSEHREVTKTILDTADMNVAQDRKTPGILLPARGTLPQWVGYVVPAHLYLLKSIDATQKRMTAETHG